MQGNFRVQCWTVRVDFSRFTFSCRYAHTKIHHDDCICEREGKETVWTDGQTGIKLRVRHVREQHLSNTVG